MEHVIHRHLSRNNDRCYPFQGRDEFCRGDATRQQLLMVGSTNFVCWSNEVTDVDEACPSFLGWPRRSTDPPCPSTPHQSSMNTRWLSFTPLHEPWIRDEPATTWNGENFTEQGFVSRIDEAGRDGKTQGACSTSTKFLVGASTFMSTAWARRGRARKLVAKSANFWRLASPSCMEVWIPTSP